MQAADDINDQLAETPACYVAETLPPAAEQPAPARKINFWKAFFCYWIIPGRLGPHLAVASLRRALIAHVLAVVLTLILILAAAVYDFQASNRYYAETLFRDLFSLSNGWQTLTMLRAQAVVDFESAMMSSNTAGGMPSKAEVVELVLAPVGAELSLIVLAVFLMPWAAAGDRPRSVFMRSLKNVYWSTTLLVPFAICGIAFYFFEEYEQDFASLPETLLILVGLVFVILPVFLVIRTWLRGAGAYVGEPKGPSYSPRQPTCDQCGYLIIGLPADARCPECGLRVSASLPGGRRQPTRWSQYPFRLAGMRDLLRLQYKANTIEFYETIPAYTGLSGARSFAYASILVMALITLAVLSPFVNQLDDNEIPLVMVALLVAGFPLIAHIAIMTLASIYVHLTLRMGDFRPGAIAACYCTPMIWPTHLVVLIAGVAILLGVVDDLARFGAIELGTLELTYVLLAAIGWGFLVTTVAMIQLARVTKALRCIQHANV